MPGHDSPSARARIGVPGSDFCSGLDHRPASDGGDNLKRALEVPAVEMFERLIILLDKALQCGQTSTRLRAKSLQECLYFCDGSVNGALISQSLCVGVPGQEQRPDHHRDEG